MPRQSHQASFKAATKLPLNDDRQEKAVRFQSRHALHELQMNSLKAAASPVRKRTSLGVSGSPRTPGEDKENADSQGLGVVGGTAVTPMKRVPILANFEEWMKMATDNKINANNSWNFALIDYFHDMSLLREGDSVNFQKASCTLDGCVKIYTSRVDSVATETGKLLSGLADSNSKKRKGDGDEEDGAGEDEEGDEEDGEDGVKKRARKRVQRSSEATLASSFAQLQLKKMELEFSVDPLFKKASADFDEGGAKGLLLNHLTIDGTGRIVFDSSDDGQATHADEGASSQEAAPAEEKAADNEEASTNQIDIEALGRRFFPDLSKLDEQDICPSLKTFEPGGASASLDIPFLKASDDWKKDAPAEASGNAMDEDIAMGGFGDDDDGGIGGFDVAADVGFGEGGEAWAKEAAIETQPRPVDAGFAGMGGDNDDEDGNMGPYSADGAAYGVTLQRHPDDHANILSYFDKTLHKNWAGPEHWRIRKMREASSKPATTRQRKEKEPFVIDFAAPMTQATADALYTPATSNSVISLPRSQWKSKTRNLLPDDKHFNSRQLLQLFLKPKARIGARARGGPTSADNVAPTEMDGAFWARQHEAAAQAAADDEGAAPTADYDANFFQDDALGAPQGMDDEDDEQFADAQEVLAPGVDGDVMTGVDGALQGDAKDGFGAQLVTQSRRLRPEYVQYARVAKKVDVRRLKEEMWKGIGFTDILGQSPPPREETPIDAPAPNKPPADDSELKFTSVINNLQAAYPEKAMSDISTSYCFICLLHLANEKGLVLENASDFQEIGIRRDHTAEITEGDA